MRPQADRRPAIAAAVMLAVVSVLVFLAAGASDRIAPAPLDAPGVSSLAIVTAAPAGTSPRVQAVAVEAIVSALRADPSVATARPAGSSGTHRTIEVRLNAPGEHEAAQAIARISTEIDPGPLTFQFAAAPLVLEDARSSVQADLGKLELLVVPFAILVLAATAGVRGGVIAALAAMIALAGALTALRLSGGYLVAFAPAAAIGLAHAIELSALLTAIHHEEALFEGGGNSVQKAIRTWSRPAVAASAVRGLGPMVLLVTSFDEAGSIALASGVATLLAACSVALLGPPILRFREARLRDRMAAEGRPGRAVRGAPRVIARSRLVLAAVLVVVVGSSVALASPAHDAASAPLAARDLPAGSPARTAGAALAAVEPGLPQAQEDTGDGPLPGLVIAGALLVLGVGLLNPAGNGRRLAALFSVLPAAATLGLLVFAVQNGHAADLTGSRSSLVQGVVVGCLAAVAAISAGRTVLAASLARTEARGGVGRIGAAELTSGLTMPGVTASTLVVAGSFAVLAGADLHAARALGLGIAAGVVLDFVLVRTAFLAVLARWGQ
jgi:hypothetical protein